MKKMIVASCTAAAVIFSLPAIAQDFRASQYQAIPLLVNPAQTGDFKGSSFRVHGLYSFVNSDSGKNKFQNISLDSRIGKKKLWAVGVNYLQSGDPSFPMSGQYLGVSVAKGFYLDKYHLHEFRVGAQVSYLQGNYDASKGNYFRSLDVRVLRYYPTNMPPNFTGSKSYLNYSYGFKYKFTTQRLQFETGISAYNITNPWGWNFMPQSDYRKRYRVDALTSFTYAYNAKNSYRLQHYSWKEGIYLTYYYPVQDDTTEIHETTYSLTWLRTNEKHPWSLGLYSRSWEAVYAVFGYNITKGFGLSVSYEAPIYRPYYSLSHFEVSTTIIPYGKKEREKLAPTPEEIVANRVSLMPFNSTECAPATKIETVRLVNMDTIRALVREAIQCPKDTDGDGIPDNIDKCPTVYGSIYNGGCPLDDKRDKPVEVNKIIAAIPSETDAPDTAKFTVYFDYDIYVLNSTAFTVTNQLVAFLRTHNQYRVSLVGLASLEGESEYNMKLSRRRVNSVATYLMSYGIDEKKISISYAGNKLARITSPDRENRWPDRKVEVYLIADGGK